MADEDRRAESDEFVELQEQARDALYEVIMASEPGTGWVLHEAYTMLKDGIARREKQERKRERSEELSEWKRASAEAEAHWQRLDKAGRQRLALDALGDGRLTAREIFERVACKLPEHAIYRSMIDPVLKLLLEAREVERVREQRGARMVWVYERRRALEGEIAGLDAAFRKGTEGWKRPPGSGEP